jgi:hypothetical protein
MMIYQRGVRSTEGSGCSSFEGPTPTWKDWQEYHLDNQGNCRTAIKHNMTSVTHHTKTSSLTHEYARAWTQTRTHLTSNWSDVTPLCSVEVSDCTNINSSHFQTHNTKAWAPSRHSWQTKVRLFTMWPPRDLSHHLTISTSDKNPKLQKPDLMG